MQHTLSQSPTQPWGFANTFVTELPSLCLPVAPIPVARPSLVVLNTELAGQLGLDPSLLRSQAGIAALAGNAFPPDAAPVAQAYAGHQFGQFSPILGDGRAMLVGELVDQDGRRHDLALKGSGPTRFARSGDGRAALGPVLRELILGEAMHGLGIHTTRALAAVRTGEPVLRQTGPQPGAVLARVAESHLRVGTFQLARTQDSLDMLRDLADYAIARHYPDCAGMVQPYLALLARVVAAQAQLLAAWMSVGFIHGVMNTDNMSISGQTIDYGPCAFMEAYREDAVYSSIDLGGRYRYGNQPAVATWNLARFAEALLPLLGADKQAAVGTATQIVNGFAGEYENAYLQRMRDKLGIGQADSSRGMDPRGATELQDAEDTALIARLRDAMQAGRADYTLVWRRLATDLARSAGHSSGPTPAPPRGPDSARALFEEPALFDAWWPEWLHRLGHPGPAAAKTVAAAMEAVNPLYIARNHLVEQVLQAAEQGEDGPLEELLGVVSDPYRQRTGWERYAAPAPAGFDQAYVTFCGT